MLNSFLNESKTEIEQQCFELALVSKECSFTICGLAISLGSLSIQVNGT